MIRHNFKSGSTTLRFFASALALVLALSGCGGGGGSGDPDSEPAPQTFNGLVLTLYTGGVSLTFIRADGDAVTGVESGAITMAENPQNADVVDASGAPGQLIPSGSITSGRYTYQRTSPEGGFLIVEGIGSGVNGEAEANYFLNPSFTRRYDLLFGTNGVTITGVNVNDSGEGFTYPGILWSTATLRLFGGAPVPIGWSVENSKGLVLPKLYPDGISLERLEITPANLAESPVGYQFLDSTFTRFSNATGDFIEEGVGNKDVPTDPALTLINFDYQPDPNTTNRARIRIYEGSKSAVIYDMTFLDLERGTYVRENGSTGTFEFPFLEN